MADTATAARPKIVIIGAGFGGLAAAREFAGKPVDVTLIDKRNYHLFQPLLYQVATADLSPADIAWPIRSIFRDAANIRVVLGKVTGIDQAGQSVETSEGPVPYDHLIVANGAGNAYFGHDDWPAHAPGLKTVVDATTVRRNILLAFERAETAADEAERHRQLTFVIIGGGPTGVEMAGAIAELARVALARDFRQIDPRAADVVLVEGGPRILPALSDDLSTYARAALEKLGVEVHTGTMVEDIDGEGVTVGGARIPAATVIWGAGVGVYGPSEWLDRKPERGGRIAVGPDLALPGHPEIRVIGDAAAVAWPEGPGENATVPGIAPAAKQMGKYAAKAILAAIAGKPSKSFRYRHAGNLATIGRHSAVVDLGRFKLTGWPAWWFWGLAHIYFLIGVRAASLVLLQWFWTYLTRRKGARLITGVTTEAHPVRDSEMKR
jgi:NADH dehydrogenase